MKYLYTVHTVLGFFGFWKLPLINCILNADLKKNLKRQMSEQTFAVMEQVYR